MTLDEQTRRPVGERVELRDHSRENYPLYAEWYGDPEVWNLTSWANSPLSPEAVAQLFDRRKVSRADCSFAIHRRGEETPIGVISLTNVSRANSQADLSVIVGSREDREQGFGPEAIDLILEYGFEEVGLERIGLSVFDFNTPAISVYQKLGFKEEGRVKKAIKRDGERYDAILMNILESEWRSRRETGNL